MDHSKLKIILCIAVGLAMLSAPFTLEIAPDGKAFAMGSRDSDDDGQFPTRKAPPRKTEWRGYTIQKSGENDGSRGTRTTHKVPEPTTIILVGSGLAGLAIFRRKFKN
jgi:hypothetical protein